MQQRISIFVVCDSSGREIFATMEDRISSEGFSFDEEELLKKSHLAFSATYLDLWSIRDSFERFLFPRKKVRHFTKGMTLVWAIRREDLVVRNSPRNEEEIVFRTFLMAAKNMYKAATTESYLFVVRTVWTASDGFNPEP